MIFNRIFLYGVIFLCLISLQACENPDPIRIGFISGISGKVADMGLAQRNGALLAIELRNQAGGINGREIKLIIRDDGQNKSMAVKSMHELVEAGVEAIIGPSTSSMALVQVPIAEKNGILMISPTVTTTLLSGIDDSFFRVTGSTKKDSQFMAKYLADTQGYQSVAIAYDNNNKAYTADWVRYFNQIFEKHGRVIKEIDFNSAKNPDYSKIVKQLTQEPPEVLLFLANAVDTARLAQISRELFPAIPIGATAWAASETLIEMAGKSSNGIMLAQYYDRDSKIPAYLAYKKKYRGRFQDHDGFSDIMAYDATNALLDAYRLRKPKQNLKQALLSLKKIPGLQQPVIFDQFGDSDRNLYMTQIVKGQFKRVK